jgi:hypothetical protein
VAQVLIDDYSVAAFFYPDGDAVSALGGSETANAKRDTAFVLARGIFGGIS